jgi:hypothetical protein
MAMAMTSFAAQGAEAGLSRSQPATGEHANHETMIPWTLFPHP